MKRFEKNIVFSAEKQIESLCHFKSVDDAWLTELKKSFLVSDHVLQLEFEKPVSKFHPSFAKNPEDLIAKIREGFKGNCVDVKDMRQTPGCSVHFTKGAYPSGIGLDCLVHIPELPPQSMMEIRIVNQNGLHVQTVPSQPKPTWQLNIFFNELEDSIEILSVFPGLNALPFPDVVTQSREDYVKCLIFWRDYAFCQLAIP
jgi:hypothetical protein